MHQEEKGGEGWEEEEEEMPSPLDPYLFLSWHYDMSSSMMEIPLPSMLAPSRIKNWKVEMKLVGKEQKNALQANLIRSPPLLQQCQNS